MISVEPVARKTVEASRASVKARPNDSLASAMSGAMTSWPMPDPAAAMPVASPRFLESCLHGGCIIYLIGL